MTFFNKRLYIIVYLVLNYVAALAQNNDSSRFADSLAKKFEYYAIAHQTGVLYAHFDKTIYTNSENIWFTAYLLHSGSDDDVLSVLLVRDNDHVIALHQKFAMAGGLSFGNVFLPDSIPPGNYSFVLYTNNVSNDKPANVFTQPITIKNTTTISFNANLQLLDTAEFPASGIRKVLLLTDTRSHQIISGASVQYYVGSRLHPSIYGKAKTDKSGQWQLSIPVDRISLNNNILNVKITHGSETKTIRLNLPVQQNLAIVKFYPEGGNLTDDVLSTVGWEVKNAWGNPYKTSGVIYQDGKPMDTIATNSYGLGRFKIRPQKSSRYYVKLNLRRSGETIYNLPEIKSDQPMIAIAHAVTDDTLTAVIRARKSQPVYIVIHNFNGLNFLFPLSVTEAGRRLKIALNEVPAGINEITVLDSLHRPCAERLFFAHYSQRNKLNIQTNKNDYKTREKVALNLDLLNKKGEKLTGFASIACIQANRSELRKATDIESYFYLNYNLGSLPVKQNYMGYTQEDKTFLEDILLIKGWRRYNWNDLTAVTARDTVRQKDTLVFKGVVTRYEKPVKKAVELLIMRDSLVNTVATSSDGVFAVNNSALFVSENKKVHIVMTGKSDEGYNITMTDPYDKVDKLVASYYTPPNYDNSPKSQIDNNPDDLKGLEHVIHLKEVKIVAGNDRSIYSSYLTGANACGDYVCVYNILNCPNHRDAPGNVQPVKGHAYIYNGFPGYIYQGCMAEDKGLVHNKVVDGIKYSLEFYPSDYEQYNPPDPEFLSTIYWKHFYKISPGNKNIEFYTGDITGDFKIVVQGVTNNGDVVSAEKYFKVHKP